jgi:hypothetical protein
VQSPVLSLVISLATSPVLLPDTASVLPHGSALVLSSVAFLFLVLPRYFFLPRAFFHLAAGFFLFPADLPHSFI